MIRFIHTADIHFGMENYGRLDIKTGIHSRLLDFQKAVNYIIDRALEEDIDFFLFSGDAYKTHHPSPTHQKLLLSCFLRLHKAGIPLVIVVGNHDNPLSFGKAHALELFGQLPLEGFHVIAQPTTLLLETKSGPVQIVGIPWPTRSLVSINNKHMHTNAQELADYISTAVASIIEKSAEKLDHSIPAVLAGHLTVSTGIFSGSEKKAIYGSDPILLPSQLALKPFDYVGLGHLHRYQNLNPLGYPALVYSGSPERIDFGERKEEKGFCLVTIAEKNRTTHEFIKIPTRRFLQIEVKIESQEDQTELLLEALAQHDMRDAIVKIIYYLPAGIRDKIDLIRINHGCMEAWHVVAVQCVRQTIVRSHRPGLKVEMDLATLLGIYFDTKPEAKVQKKELIERALLLDAEKTEES